MEFENNEKLFLMNFDVSSHVVGPNSSSSENVSQLKVFDPYLAEPDMAPWVSFSYLTLTIKVGCINS